MKFQYNQLAKVLLAGVFAVGLSACTTVPKNPSAPSTVNTQSAHVSGTPFSFVVIGDTPYNDADKAMLKTAVKEVDALKPPFIIHVGDTQAGGEKCGPALDDRFDAFIKKLAPAPVYYTPGDNEWTDCDRQYTGDTGVRFSEIDRLDTLRKRFFAGAPTHSGSMKYATQKVQPENASWVYGDVRFFTLHVPSTGNARTQIMGDPKLHAKQAAELRDAANLYWVKAQFQAASFTARGKPLENPARAIVISMQADMTGFEDDEKQFIGKPCLDVTDKWKINCDGFVALRAAIAKEARVFNGPVLLIHGDTSAYTLNQKMLGDTAPNLWRLNAAGDTWFNPKTGESGGVRDVTLVTIDLDNANPFSATGLITGQIPDP